MNSDYWGLNQLTGIVKLSNLLALGIEWLNGHKQQSLLNVEETLSVEVINRDGRSGIVLVCEHEDYSEIMEKRVALIAAVE